MTTARLVPKKATVHPVSEPASQTPTAIAGSAPTATIGNSRRLVIQFSLSVSSSSAPPDSARAATARPAPAIAQRTAVTLGISATRPAALRRHQPVTHHCNADAHGEPAPDLALLARGRGDRDESGHQQRRHVQQEDRREQHVALGHARHHHEVDAHAGDHHAADQVPPRAHRRSHAPGSARPAGGAWPEGRPTPASPGRRRSWARRPAAQRPPRPPRPGSPAPKRRSSPSKPSAAVRGAARPARSRRTHRARLRRSGRRPGRRG